MTAAPLFDLESLDDGELARLVELRDRDAVRLVTNRNNQRLFRAAWSILGNRADSEDVVQTTYLRAFDAIATFEARSSLSTWLTRIAINEALGRRRAERRRRARFDSQSVVDLEYYREQLMRGSTGGEPPDAGLAREQLRLRIEQAVARLKEAFRSVFVLRDIEGLSVDETADALGLAPATVKTRLFRARRQLRDDLAPDIQSALTGSFPFAGPDCAAMTERVIEAYCRPA